MAATSFLKALGIGSKALKVSDREAEILARRALQGDEGSLYMLSEKTGLAPDYIINGAKDIIAGIDAGKTFDRSGGVIPNLWHGTAATFDQDAVKVLNQRTGNVESYPKSVGDEILRQADEYGKTGMQVVDQNPYGYFDHSYMGSGEGLQAYGYGTYLTETPDIARGYRDANLTTKTGNPAHDQPIFDELMNKYNRIINNPNASNSDYDKAAILEQVLLDLDLQGVQSRGADMYGKEAIDWFNKTIVPSFNRKGSLYKTEISGTPDDYLLWDKPMSEQSEGLLTKIDDYLRSQPEWQDYYNSLPDDAKPMADKLLSKRIYASEDAYTDEFIDLYKKAPKANHEVFYDLPAEKGVGFTENMLGADFYRRKDPRQIFTSSGSDQESSQFLNDTLGIKGIKYNDGASRGSDGGTSNYVIFDDKNINITDKWLRPETVAVTSLLGAGALAGSDKAMANPVSDLRASEAQWDMTPEERAIADLRASEDGFMPTSDPQWKPARLPWLADTLGQLKGNKNYQNAEIVNPLASTVDALYNTAMGADNTLGDYIFTAAETVPVAAGASKGAMTLWDLLRGMK